MPRSKNNVINSAIIRNGFVGIEVDSQPVNANPNLRLSQTRIYNMAAAGLVGYSSHITAINNEISECGQYGFLGALGGNYQLTHNTFVSYNGNFNRQTPLVIFDNTPYTDEDGVVIAKYALTIGCVNNIIEGSLEEEILINNNAQGLPIQSPIIQTNLLRTKQAVFNVNGNVLNKDPNFNNSTLHDYRLKDASPAKGIGTNVGVNVDIKNNARNAAPSVGCWE